MSKEQQLSISKAFLCLKTFKHLKDNPKELKKYDWNNHSITMDDMTNTYPFLKEIKCHQ